MDMTHTITLEALVTFCRDVDERMKWVGTFSVMICDFGEASTNGQYNDFVQLTFSHFGDRPGGTVTASPNVRFALELPPYKILWHTGTAHETFELEDGWELTAPRDQVTSPDTIGTVGA